MPVYKQDTPATSWGSKRLLTRADLMRRAKAINLRSLRKLSCNYSAVTFPDNDGKVLAKAIGSARQNPYGHGAATGAAPARAPQQQVHVVMRKYLGRVKSLEGDDVIAEIGPADDMDRWDVVIPRASFKEEPQLNQEIDCTIVRWGSHADVTVQASSNKPLPELKDFGIDEEELLTWASQLNV